MRTFIFGLAMLASTGAQAATVSTTLQAGGLLGVTFELGAGASFLDLTTNGSTYVGDGGRADTVIGLFDGTARGASLIGSDDDNGDLFLSFLTFGPSDRVPAGADAGPRAAGVPGAGTYTLVVTGFPTPLGASAELGRLGRSGEDRAIDISLNIASDAAITNVVFAPIVPVPLPATGGLLGGAVALFGLSRLPRRRNA